MRHYGFEISQLIDGELPDDKKSVLFSHIYRCQKCRKTLSEYTRIKSTTNEFFRLLPGTSYHNYSYNFSAKSRILRLITPLTFAVSAVLVMLILNQPTVYLVNINPIIPDDDVKYYSITPDQDDVTQYLQSRDFCTDINGLVLSEPGDEITNYTLHPDNEDTFQQKSQ